MVILKTNNKVITLFHNFTSCWIHNATTLISKFEKLTYLMLVFFNTFNLSAFVRLKTLNYFRIQATRILEQTSPKS